MQALSWRCCAPCALLVAVTILGSIRTAESDELKPKREAGEAVEFFAAVKAGEVEARLIPRDSRKATVWVENKTDKPLAIRMPLGFAAVPVLAQFGGPPGGFHGFPPPGGDRNGAPQMLGAPGNNFPNMNFAGPGGGPGGAVDGFLPPGIFNVPAEKTIKARVPCVCLEHGKPNPNPRIPYEIVPLEDVHDQPELAELLAMLGQGGYSQRVVQAVAWHLANDMTW